MLDLILHGKSLADGGCSIDEAMYDFERFHRHCQDSRSQLSQAIYFRAAPALLEYMSPESESFVEEPEYLRMQILAGGHRCRSPVSLLRKIFHHLSLSFRNDSHMKLISSTVFSMRIMGHFNKKVYQASKDHAHKCDCDTMILADVWPWDYSKTTSIKKACKSTKNQDFKKCNNLALHFLFLSESNFKKVSVCHYIGKFYSLAQILIL